MLQVSGVARVVIKESREGADKYVFQPLAGSRIFLEEKMEVLWNEELCWRIAGRSGCCRSRTNDVAKGGCVQTAGQPEKCRHC